MAELELTQETAGTFHPTAEAFIAVLAQLNRGQTVIYARGQLARSLHLSGSNKAAWVLSGSAPLSPELVDGQPISADKAKAGLYNVAQIALADANRGLLCLTQRRVAPGNGFGMGGVFEYRVTRR